MSFHPSKILVLFGILVMGLSQPIFAQKKDAKEIKIDCSLDKMITLGKSDVFLTEEKPDPGLQTKFKKKKKGSDRIYKCKSGAIMTVRAQGNNCNIMVQREKQKYTLVVRNKIKTEIKFLGFGYDDGVYTPYFTLENAQCKFVFSMNKKDKSMKIVQYKIADF